MVHPLHKTKLTVSYQDVLEIRDRMFEAFGQYQDKYLESLDAKNMGKKTAKSPDYYKGMRDAYGKSMHFFDKLTNKMHDARMKEINGKKW